MFAFTSLTRILLLARPFSLSWAASVELQTFSVEKEAIKDRQQKISSFTVLFHKIFTQTLMDFWCETLNWFSYSSAFFCGTREMKSRSKINVLKWRVKREREREKNRNIKRRLTAFQYISVGIWHLVFFFESIKLGSRERSARERKLALDVSIHQGVMMRIKFWRSTSIASTKIFTLSKQLV